MPARILLVAADQSAAAAVDVLTGEGHRLVAAHDAREALALVDAERPDLALVDAELGGSSGPDLLRRLRATDTPGSHLPLILFGAAADVAAKVSGLRAGADDYLAKPLHPVELSARVRALLARHAPRAQQPAVATAPGRVLAFYGAKGGVGTTTLAINAAIALRRNVHRSVALVDANLQFGDHRVFLDLGTDRRSIVDAVTATEIDQDILRRTVVRHESGIDLLLAPVTPENAELVNAEHHHLHTIIEALRGMYEYVLVDLDKRFDEHTLDVISLAESLVVVMTADLSCLKNVRLVLDTMAQIGVPEERMQLVLNRSNAYTGINPKAVESVLRREINFQVVNDYRVAIGSLNTGSPVMMRRADSPIAKGIIDMVTELDGPAEPVARPAALKLVGAGA